MARINRKLTAVCVADQVIKTLGDKRLKRGKDEHRGKELRTWVKTQIKWHGQREASEHLKNRAATKVIEYMYSVL